MIGSKAREISLFNIFKRFHRDFFKGEIYQPQNPENLSNNSHRKVL